MSHIRQLGRMLFKLVPAYNDILYEFCVRYVDRFNGDNNSTQETNGEYFFLRNELPKLGDGGVVFDVGANIGDWASFALGLNSKLNLHCFEPSKATYVKLAQKEWPSNVSINNIGLGEVEGVMELNVVGDGSGLNSLYLRRGIDCAVAVKKEIINITTIDDYCEKNAIQGIDLIKIDVEGHELAVFQGMRHMLTQERVRIIQFEYGGCNLDSKVHLGDIWYFLEHYAFNFYKLYPDGLHRIKKYQQGLETFKYSNWVAIHGSHDSFRT
jgi:FkbM family methyltransferase